MGGGLRGLLLLCLALGCVAGKRNKWAGVLSGSGAAESAPLQTATTPTTGGATERCENERAWSKLLEAELQPWTDGALTTRQQRASYDVVKATNYAAGVLILQPDGHLKTVINNLYLTRATDFMTTVANAFLRYPHMLPPKPVEMVWSMDDLPVDYAGHSEATPAESYAPVFGYSQMRDDSPRAHPGPQMTQWAIPDYSFTSSETTKDRSKERLGGVQSNEASLRDTWSAQCKTMLELAQSRPYAQREKRAIFRGMTNWAREALLEALGKEYGSFDGLNQHFDVDVMYRNMTDKSWYWKYERPNVATTDYSKYAVQVYVDGNGASARFKLQLFTGTPIVHVSDFDDFFGPLMTPGVHYYHVSSFEEIPTAVKYLLAHPEEAAAIGRAGLEFAQKYLTQASVDCYTMTAIDAMSRKMGYEPTEHKGMASVTRVVDGRPQLLPQNEMVAEAKAAVKAHPPCEFDREGCGHGGATAW